ncbi:unnamed protein product, partial [Meganyctiphanes norvegica]
ILRLLPDLAGRLAEAGNLSAESTYEQRTAGLTLLTPNEKQRIRSLNKRYWDRFGFPFVVCARRNKKDTILAGLEQRIQNTIEDEVRTGVEEVLKICYLR